MNRMVTYFDQQLLDKLPESGPVPLPSSFQIGQAIEVVLDGGIIPAHVYAIKFSGNGTVSYDLAVHIKNSSFYAIINNIRGGMRKLGDTEIPSDLIETVKIEHLVRRASFKIIDGGQQGE